MIPKCFLCIFLERLLYSFIRKNIKSFQKQMEEFRYDFSVYSAKYPVNNRSEKENLLQFFWISQLVYK